MKRIVPALTLLLAVVIVAVAACWFSVRHFTKHSQPSYTEAHQWFHTQIGITAEQERRLEPIEQRYAEERKHSTQKLRIANNELAQAILADRQDSPRVAAAVMKIHEAMADLQHATMQHIFEMKSVLTPEQYDKLLKLSADALQHAEEGR